MNSDYLPENEVINYEDTLYVNPETSLQEQTTFIDNLRNVQNQNNAEIATDTANLGTAVPSTLGGLGGGESYFTSRNQAPQGVALANNLRATAQAQALNDAMNMNLEAWKKRLSDTQKAAARRARASYGGSRGGGGGGGNPSNTPSGDNVSSWDGEIETVESPTKESYGVPGADVSETDTHYIYTDQNTGEKVYVSKDYMNKIYDKNGNVTDDGAVILDTRRLLGL